MSYSPTDEQVAIIDAAASGKSITIQARAGTGKTTTLVATGEKLETLGKTGFYIVYNNKAARDAEKKFPKNVKVKTGHGLAFAPMMHRIFSDTPPKERFNAMKNLLDSARTTRKEICNILSINVGMGDQDTFLSASKLAGFVMETVKNFCYSDAQVIGNRHVPKVPGTEDYRDEFVEFCVRKAKLAWDDLTNAPNNRIRFEHDHYLKMFALEDPRLNGDFILLDEAQDANPVVVGIMNNQEHMQRIMVGDSCQSIYSWRGAVDALSQFDSDVTLYLSKSFRFGPAVAEEANKWLRLLGETVLLEGHDPVGSVVAPFDEGDPFGTAVLCRTNAEVLGQAMAAQEAGKKVAIVGGAQALAAYAEAALDLMAGKGTWHHELQAFKTWTAVQQYCIDEREEAGSLAVMVKMIDTYGPHAILELAANCSSEFDEDVEVILSTAHKAKGAEWDNVRIGLDFTPNTKEDSENGKPNREAMMLSYVAVTRAKKQLDNSGLSWVDSFLDEGHDD